MSDFLSLASARRSIRKYEERNVSREDLEYFIKAAVTAPSGCNSQCWKFVAVRDKDTIRRMGKAAVDKMEELLQEKRQGVTEQYLNSKRKMVSFFMNAPVVIAVFMTHLEYYDPTVIEALEAKGCGYEDIMKFFAYPDVLSIGAAIQNLLLAVQEKGYGACWMNEPAVAAEEITRILGEPAEHKLISLVPVGWPAYTPRGKELKLMQEVFRIVE